MPFEAGLNRAWYNKGKTAGRSGRYVDMYAAWQKAPKKPKTSGNRVTAQESFFQGWLDGMNSNPSKRSTLKRVSKALTKYVRGQNSKGNPARSKAKRITIRNAASVTITKLPGGAVGVRVVKKKR